MPNSKFRNGKIPDIPAEVDLQHEQGTKTAIPMTVLWFEPQRGYGVAVGLNEHALLRASVSKRDIGRVPNSGDKILAGISRRQKKNAGNNQTPMPVIESCTLADEHTTAPIFVSGSIKRHFPNKGISFAEIEGNGIELFIGKKSIKDLGLNTSLRLGQEFMAVLNKLPEENGDRSVKILGLSLHGKKNH